MTPEGAVVSKSHVSSVVCQITDGDGGGAVGKDVVLDLEHLAGDFRRGDCHHVEESDAKVEESAILLG